MAAEFEITYNDLAFSGYVQNNIFTGKNIKIASGENLSTNL